jgi:hypothetical protein
LFEMSSSPDKSGFAGIRLSSDLQKQIDNMRIRQGRRVMPIFRRCL